MYNPYDGKVLLQMIEKNVDTKIAMDYSQRD